MTIVSRNSKQRKHGKLYPNANLKDLTGQRFNRLVVIGLSKNYVYGQSIWECLCDCGNKTDVFGGSLTSGNTKSCGCLSKEMRAGEFNVSKRPEVKIKISKGRIAVHDKISALQKGSNNSRWLGGISFEPYCPKFDDDLRLRIREFFDNTCILCGKTEEENKKALSCHHVEYNKEACCDGKPIHFAALCASCHAKTNNNRLYWENILHWIIDEIYNGKSYYTKSEWKHKLDNLDKN